MKNIKLTISKLEMASKSVHSKNENHMKECIAGHRMTKNAKKYTRQTKHKKAYEY